jgi:DNA-binding transcriptional LysR family regulator
VAQFDSLDALRHAALEGLGVALGRMVTSKSLIDAGRLKVLGDNYLPVSEAYWLVYPPRSLEHRGLQVFREWLLAEADDYCRQLPGMSHGGAVED